MIQPTCCFPRDAGFGVRGSPGWAYPLGGGRGPLHGHLGARSRGRWGARRALEASRRKSLTSSQVWYIVVHQ